MAAPNPIYSYKTYINNDNTHYGYVIYEDGSPIISGGFSHKRTVVQQQARNAVRKFSKEANQNNVPKVTKRAVSFNPDSR